MIGGTGVSGELNDEEGEVRGGVLGADAFEREQRRAESDDHAIDVSTLYGHGDLLQCREPGDGVQ